MTTIAYGNTITSAEIALDEDYRAADCDLKPLQFLEAHTAAVMCFDGKIRPYPTNKYPKAFVGLFANTVPITRLDKQTGKMTAAIYTTGMASVLLEPEFVATADANKMITLGYSGFEVMGTTPSKETYNQTGFYVGKILGFASNTNKNNPIVCLGGSLSKTYAARRTQGIKPTTAANHSIAKLKQWPNRIGAAMEETYDVVITEDANGKFLVDDNVRRPGMVVDGSILQKMEQTLKF